VCTKPIKEVPFSFVTARENNIIYRAKSYNKTNVFKNSAYVYVAEPSINSAINSFCCRHGTRVVAVISSSRGVVGGAKSSRIKK
jgi:hypothetical protein